MYRTILSCIQYLFPILFVTLLYTVGFAQNTGPNLATRRSSEELYKKERIAISPRQLLFITRNNPEAYQVAKTARTYKNVGSVIGFAGGFMVGYGVVSYINGEATRPLVAAGGALILGSIPFQLGYASHARKAVQLLDTHGQQVRQGHYRFSATIALTKIKIAVDF